MEKGKSDGRKTGGKEGIKKGMKEESLNHLEVPNILSYCHMQRGIVSRIRSGGNVSVSIWCLNCSKKNVIPAALDVCSLLGIHPD